MKLKSIIIIWMLFTGYSQFALSADPYLQYLKPFFNQHKKDMTIHTADQVSTYTKSKYNRGDYYIYVLIHRQKVVYCGISIEPNRREGEHRNDKVFDTMVAAGKVSEKSARAFEQDCVCRYNPKYNKLPTCPIIYVGGGRTFYIE